MAKELKDSKMVSFKLRNDLLKLLEEYSNKTGITKTRLIENALDKYLKEVNV